MTKKRSITKISLGLAMALLAAEGHAGEFSGDEVKLGVLTDMQGVFSTTAGIGSVTAVQMAVKDFGGTVNGHPIKVISGDHLNKTDVGTSTAREWYDREGVDAIFDISNSAVALAVMSVTKEKDRIIILGATSTTKITTDDCTPNSIQYIYDANALSNITGKALVEKGYKSWYFVTVDFAFGIGLQKTTTRVVEEAGGKVIGSVRHPLDTTDFSSYILQAQASGAQVIALANSGTDLVNAIKTAREFHIAPKQSVASLLTVISDVHSMGLDEAQGTLLTEAFYWDLNEETRQWAKRFYDERGFMPTSVHAGMYSAALHYLKAIQDEDTDSAGPVMKRMKTTPVNDLFAQNGHIREDGLHVRDMYLMQVKKPSESKYPWDYYNVLARVPADKAFSPMTPGACKYVK